MAERDCLSDEDLLGRSTRGDEEAFTVLYRRFQGPVFRFAAQMSGSKAVAEEVTQEVFLALIRSGARVNTDRAPLIAWLLGIARNHVLRALDRDSRYRELKPVSAGEPAAQGSNQLEELTRNEGIQRLRSAIMALPPRYREVVVLCDLEEISYEDAARVLDCATGTIRSRLHRARALLAGRLRMHVRCPA